MNANLTDLLDNIESLAAQARAAIADEHEGNLKQALHLLNDYADQATDLVDRW